MEVSVNPESQRKTLCSDETETDSKRRKNAVQDKK
jgi:hypothetical protein